MCYYIFFSHEHSRFDCLIPVDESTTNINILCNYNNNNNNKNIDIEAHTRTNWNNNYEKCFNFDCYTSFYFGVSVPLAALLFSLIAIYFGFDNHMSEQFQLSLYPLYFAVLCSSSQFLHISVGWHVFLTIEWISKLK